MADDWLTAAFEEHRPHLRAVAYRLLGSMADARGSGKGAAGDPEDEAVLADSVGLALLVVLDTLTPAERLAFVLHDMFAMPFTEVAEVLGRSADATRQLASRARRRVQGTPSPDRAIDLGRQAGGAARCAAGGSTPPAESPALRSSPIRPGCDGCCRTDRGSASDLRRPPVRYPDGGRARPGEGRVVAYHRLRPAQGQLFVQAVGDGPEARQDAGPFGDVDEVAQPGE